MALWLPAAAYCCLLLLLLLLLQASKWSAENVLFPGALPLASAGVGGLYYCCCSSSSSSSSAADRRVYWETHGKGNLPVGQTAPGWENASPCVCRGRRKMSYSLARSPLRLPGSADIYIYIHDIFGPIIIQLVLRRTGAWLRRTGAWYFIKVYGALVFLIPHLVFLTPPVFFWPLMNEILNETLKKLSRNPHDCLKTLTRISDKKSYTKP